MFPSYEQKEFRYLLERIADKIPEALLVETLVKTRKTLVMYLSNLKQANPSTLPPGWNTSFIPGYWSGCIHTIENLIEGEYFFNHIAELIAEGASFRELEEKGYPLIKFAAYTGNIDLLETELLTQPPQEVIQRCFELAADNRHIEAADKLV